MATTLSHSESRRLYSWWWDSHITPNNSKWLKENLTDMDSKVKAMIKLIEEDADTFARRAEMYYKKRPELIKLVEGFYRAYRALAERYDHATVELHQAHCTIVEAIPDNESLLDPGALPTESRELSSAELSSRGLKQLSDIFASETMKGGEVDIHASAEVKALKQAISKLKQCTELQYEVCSRRIAELELEISRAHEDVKRLSNEVEAGDAKLKCVEEERDLLAKTNQSLLLATGDLAEKIANKDQEVFHKGKELEALQTLLQDEQCRFTEAEASLKSLQKLHSQSQEEQKASASELDSKLQMLKDLETSNHDLEEFCQKIKDEKSTLLQERSNLLAQLQDSEIRLGDLEARFVKLEGKCNDLERDKDSALIQVKELQVFLSVEKEERASYAQSSESRIADLEKQVHSLQEERTLSKKESEKQLDRALNAQVEIFVLQKFIEDLKQKNLSLLFECQKANKLMSEFEAENLEQQEEIEFLLDEIETLRKGTNQVFSALQVYPVTKHSDGFDEEPIPFGLMLDVVKNLKCSFLKNDDEKQQLAVENLVLCTFLKQLRLEGAELSSVSKSFEQDMIQQVIALEKHKFELLEKNEKLRVDGNKQEEVLRAHLESRHLNLVSLEDSYQALREENFQLVQQNSSTSQNLADLEEKNGKLEKKLQTKESENSKLLENFEVLHKKLNEGENLNDQLHCQMVIGKELLKQQALELLQADQKLHVVENFNAEVCSTIKELKRKCASTNVVKKNMEIEILALSENLVNQKEEIEGLRKTNEGHRMKEENLTLELHERVNEFELWESEASSFYFDLQACSIREVILEKKVHELASACEHLEEMNDTKDSEIERMKGRFSSLESEIDGLKAQLSAYGPAIASLRKNVESLEHNALLGNLSKARCVGSSGEDTAIRAPEQIYQELEESRRGEVTDGISDLLKMQVRIETVEKAMVEQASRLKTEEVSVPEAHATTIRSKVKLDAPSGGAELWELKDWLTGRDNSFRKEARNALPGKDCDMSMKDIPLDQMLDRSSRSSSNMNSSTGSESVAEDQMVELYETVEPRFKRDPLSRSTRWKGVALSKSRSRRNVSQKRRDPPMEYQLEKEERFQDGNTRKILERIESDAKKLMSVQLTVQELKSKMEAKKSKKKADNIESERVKRQLLEADEAILQLFSSTNQLARDIQETPSSSPSKSSSAYLEEADDAIKRRATERARRGSEKIGRLQFEVESIRYSVLQLEDDKKSKGKKHRFPGSRTILRDFVYSGRRNSIRRRNQNACFCGCGRPLTLEN